MYASRACDSCRRRKVKCNAENPCANCRISQVACEYSHQARVRGPRVSKRAAESELPQLVRTIPRRNLVAVTGSVSIATRFNVARRKERSKEGGVNSSRGEAEKAARLSQQTLSAVQSPGFGVVPGNSVGSTSVPVFVDLGAGGEFYAICVALVNRVENILALGRSTATTTATFNLVHSCIDMFLQYMFPNTPIAHEPTLRLGASLFLPENHRAASKTVLYPKSHSHTSYAKTFALITALCAFVMSVVPDSLLPNGHILAGPFFESSKAMLRLYEESDLDQPDSTSLAIRIWHSGASQNSTGKTGPAWHYHSEASLLALRLRLYDEEAVRCDSAVESRLLRANFWLLYLADKSAAALESRTPVLTEHFFDDDLTLLKHCDHDEPLLDEARNVAQNGLEGRISLGFHLKTQIWTAAAHVITEINAHLHRQKQLGQVNEGDKDLAVAHISDLNLRFSTLIYELPPWLQCPDNIDNADPVVATYQATCLWALKSNIMTTYHCLKLVILQKCIENDIIEVLGLTRQPLLWAMRKMEILQEFINELQLVPFLCYKVQGEAGVERIRRAGIILLALVQNAENDIIRDRARSQFTQLLDFLARLDSKASDKLGKGRL